MQKYVQACGGDTRHAMTLYRYNLRLSQEMFTLVSCFEVAICFNRSSVAIDTSYVLNQYARMMRLFNWMDIDGVSLMFGLDHVNSACSKIMCL